MPAAGAMVLSVIRRIWEVLAKIHWMMAWIVWVLWVVWELFGGGWWEVKSRLPDPAPETTKTPRIYFFPSLSAMTVYNVDTVIEYYRWSLDPLSNAGYSWE